jgi:TPR repeat protein
MKKYLFMIAALVIVSCTDQMVEKDVVGDYAEQTPASDVTALIEKARWGDGQAYLQLANCYRDGKGVKQDFLNMVCMMFYANEYGGIKNRKEYLFTLPEESEYRLVYEAMDKPYSKVDEILEVANKLIARDCIEGYTMKGIMLSERNDKKEGHRLLEFAAERGSTFAQVFLCIPGWYESREPDIDRLKAMADSVPIANMLLGDIYSGKTYDESKKDDEQAAFYYMKADEHALLGKFSARWLLNYHRNGGNVNLSEKDIERFEKLASMRSSRPEDRLCEEMEVETDEFDYDGIEAVDAIEVDTIEVE